MSAETHDHREWLESAALFAVDALGGDERRAFEAHAATCVECQARGGEPARRGHRPGVRRAANRSAAALQSARADRRPGIGGRRRRRRGRHGVDPRPHRAGRGCRWPPRSRWRWAWAPTPTHCAPRSRSLEAALNTAREEAHQQSRTGADGAAGGCRRAGAPRRPDGGGLGSRATVGGGAGAGLGTRGLEPHARPLGVDRQPAAGSAGRTYQVWYLTRGMPVSAGLLRPDASGRLTGLYPVARGRARSDWVRADRGSGGRRGPADDTARAGRADGQRHAGTAPLAPLPRTSRL